MKESHPVADIFPMLPPDELQRLADDIAARGLLEPVVMLDDMILDGRNRYAACKLAGVTPDFVTFSGNDALGYVIAKNLHRRHLNESQRAVVAAKIANMKPHRPIKSANLPTYDNGLPHPVSQEQAAAMLNVSVRSVTSAKAIERDAPELIPQIESGTLSVGKAEQTIRKIQHRETLKEVSMDQVVNGKYAVIYADPPWSYRNSGFNQSAANQYPTMYVEEICKMPIEEHTTENAVLFLWATSPLLPDALSVMSAWGFEYKASMVWVKNSAPGMGWWVRTYHELLLIGCKGSIQPETKPSSVITSEVSKHSQKPDMVYDLIESMYPGLSYLELFARNSRAGWEAFGNEV